MKTIKLAILKSFKALDIHVQQYKQSCEHLHINYVIIDLFAEDWIEQLKQEQPSGCLVRVKGNIDIHKHFFDEVLFIINKELGIPIYPSYKELFLYENKRLYHYWLTANELPLVKGQVFLDKDTAIDFLKKTKYPIVFKTNGGASASGVKIVKRKWKALWMAHKVFGFFDPRLSFGHLLWYKGIVPKFGMTQKHYLIVQDFMNIRWEWRIIKIGNVYAGHKKLLKGNFASGSGLVGWEAPPKELLYMVKNMCDKARFDSMAMDVFETDTGKYYINEIQSLFGSFSPYQMKINDEPGVFVYEDNDFVFKPGEFHQYGSNILRVQDFVEKLNTNYYK